MSTVKADRRVEIVILVGNFPPPIHGMSLVNAAVLDLLKSRGVQPTVLNTSPTSLSKSMRVRLSRLPKVLKALGTVGWTGARHRGVVYMSVSGGYGQIYDCLILAAARFASCRVIVHHHSYAYLTKRKRLTAACMWLVGIDGTHIVLCDDMAQLLRALYASAAKIMVVSNAVFIRAEAPVAPRAEVRVVGFLGNISPEKGIFEFIEVMKQLAIKAPQSRVRGLIAGKFDTPQIEENIQSALTGCANVKYVGPKYGAEKARFLREIDVLVFPSKYRNEAQPLTILEAMSHGSPVIASDRGCIKELVSADSGLLVKNMATFVSDATEQLSVWIKNPALFRQVSATSLATFTASTTAAETSLEKLIEVIKRGGMNRPETLAHGHFYIDGGR